MVASCVALNTLLTSPHEMAAHEKGARKDGTTGGVLATESRGAHMRCTARWPPAGAVLPEVDICSALWIEGCDIKHFKEQFDIDDKHEVQEITAV